jgi:Ca2+-binding RTX toxin-like protein
MTRSPQATFRRNRSTAASFVEVLETRRLLSATTGIIIPTPPIIPIPPNPTVGSVTGAKASSVAITATTGVPFYGQVATLTGLTSGSTYQLSAMINWGDGSAQSAGSIFKNADNSYYVSGWHEYQMAGTFSVTVLIEATPAPVIGPLPQTKAASASGSVVTSPIILVVATVTDTATVAQGVTPVPGIGVTLHLKAGKAYSGSVGTFDYISPIEAPYKLSASIDWGDGTVTNGSIVVDSALGAGGYAVDGSHTYAVGGSYSITTTVTMNQVLPTPTPVPVSGSGGAGSATIVPIPPTVLISIIKSTAEVAANPIGPGSITIANGVLTILGTSGNDTITVRQTAATAPIVPLASTPGGADFVPVIGLPPRFIVTIDGATTTLSTAGITSLYVNGEAGNDTIDLGGLSHLTGAPPPPFLIDDAVKLDAVIHGGGGDDTLIGGDGTDKLYADNGNDTLRATLGGDSAYGGTGDDTAINIGSYVFAYIAPNVKTVINMPPPPVAPIGPIPQSSAAKAK